MRIQPSRLLIAISTILVLSISAVPLDHPLDHQPQRRSAPYSVVLVDGGSSSTTDAPTTTETSTTTATPSTVIKTVVLNGPPLSSSVSVSATQTGSTSQSATPASTPMMPPVRIVVPAPPAVLPSHSSSTSMPLITGLPAVPTNTTSYDNGQWHTYYPSWNSTTKSWKRGPPKPFVNLPKERSP